MKSISLCIASIFIFQLNLFAQKDTIPAKRIEKSKINYQSYVLTGDTLFAINDSGKLVIWSLKKLDTIHFSHNDSKTNYTAIAKDKYNNIFIGAKNGDVFKLTPSNLYFSHYVKVKYTIRYMCFNSSNKLFLIVANAIYDPVSKKHWTKFENHATGLIQIKKSYIFFHKKTSKYFSMPQYAFLDSKDRWWMTASYGEFGGEVQIFNTNTESVVSNKFNALNPGTIFPKSVFEDNNENIYITSGLQHFMNSGKIYRIDKNRNVVEICDGKIRPNTTLNDANTGRNDEEFIGPGAYNKIDNSLYFVTTTGFYKAALADNIKPEFLFNTNLSWDREPLAIGVAMSVIKIDFTSDNKLLFLTKNNGFGLYDGKGLVFIK